MKDIFVIAEWRSRGVGRELMTVLATYATVHGIGRIDLRTDASNIAAQRLYESLGGQREDKVAYTFDPDVLAVRARRV